MGSSSREAPAFASALLRRPRGGDAIAAACDRALAQLGGKPDLAVLFASHHYGPGFGPLVEQAHERLDGLLIGATAESIVGVGEEIEDEPALSLWLARLPGATIRAMRLEFERTSEGGAFVGWPDDLEAEQPAGSTLLLLGEPFSFPADALLERMSVSQPGVTVLGGMASGGRAPGENRVFLGPQEFAFGAAGVLLSAAADVKALVSQGCRPIGKPMVVTKAERQVIFELGGKPAMAQFQDVFENLPDRDQQLVQNGLHVGRVINEYQESFGPGDFLIRNLLGADRSTGAIAVGDFIRPGQTVQFHIRDALTADEELRSLLASAAPPKAALMFTCNGRGTRMFEQPHHDAGAVRDAWGDIPLAGFFAQGELGPVGGKNFMHGFTASLALFGSSL